VFLYVLWCVWASRFQTLGDCLESTPKALENDSFEVFVAIIWNCWNTWNRFIIFKGLDRNLGACGKVAISFVRSFREHRTNLSLKAFIGI